MTSEGHRALGSRKGTNVRRGSSARREELLAVAVRLFYAKGYSRTTLQDIADEMGFTKPAVYYYARNKEELLLEIYAQIVTPAIARAREIVDQPGDGATRFLLVLREHLRTFLANIEANAVFEVQQAALSPPAKRRVRTWARDYGAILARIYDEGVADGSLAPGNAKVVVNALLGMCNSVHRWFDPAGALSIDDLVDTLCALVGGGILTDSSS